MTCGTRRIFSFRERYWQRFFLLLLDGRRHSNYYSGLLLAVLNFLDVGKRLDFYEVSRKCLLSDSIFKNLNEVIAMKTDSL